MDEFNQCFGGILQFKTALFKIFVLSILELYISFLLASVYLQSTDFPARLIKMVAFSNSFSQPVNDFASQFTYFTLFAILDIPRVKITISSNLSLKCSTKTCPRNPVPAAIITFFISLNLR